MTRKEALEYFEREQEFIKEHTNQTLKVSFEKWLEIRNITLED